MELIGELVREVIIKYKSIFNDVREELWERHMIFCPSCGKETVWRENISDDPLSPTVNAKFISGFTTYLKENEKSVCVSCGAEFILKNFSIYGKDEQEADRILKMLRTQNENRAQGFKLRIKEIHEIIRQIRKSAYKR